MEAVSSALVAVASTIVPVVGLALAAYVFFTFFVTSLVSMVRDWRLVITHTRRARTEAIQDRERVVLVAARRRRELQQRAAATPMRRASQPPPPPPAAFRATAA